MRLVWLVNTILPQIADKRGDKKDVINGWTVKLADKMAEDSDIDFTVFYPQHEMRENITGNAGDIRYVGFYEEAIPETVYNPDMTRALKAEIDKINPDIVHIWGSEYVHTLSMVRAFNKPDRTVISIQGLIFYCGLAYDSGLPEKTINRHTFRDLIRKDSIKEQKEKFLKRGECEIAALKEVNHVIGRTSWDRDSVLKINPALNYHHAGEILREAFYYSGEKWSPKTAVKHRIFMTQSYYPIKGIHFVLEALQIIKKEFPDVRLAVTGKDMRPSSLKDHIKQDSYGKYICELINVYGLTDNIEFLGTKDAPEMITQYLKCSVFLLPSVMENSPNSLGEAMLLGVPCIASAVGGTPDMMKADEGWLYDYRDKDALVSAVREAFQMIDMERNGEDTGLMEMLDRGVKHAKKCYDIEKNTEAYRDIYFALKRSGINESQS